MKQECFTSKFVFISFTRVPFNTYMYIIQEHHFGIQHLKHACHLRTILLYPLTGYFICLFISISSTMVNEGFREYVNGNMLFWAANVKSTEGYRGTVCSMIKQTNVSAGTNGRNVSFQLTSFSWLYIHLGLTLRHNLLAYMMCYKIFCGF